MCSALHKEEELDKTLLAVLFALIGCSSVPTPCSESYMAAQGAALAAECKARRAVECKDFDVLEECPLMAECDKRADDIGKGCFE